jgi:hypothetical protein
VSDARVQALVREAQDALDQLAPVEKQVLARAAALAGTTTGGTTFSVTLSVTADAVITTDAASVSVSTAGASKFDPAEWAKRHPVWSFALGYATTKALDAAGAALYEAARPKVLSLLAAGQLSTAQPALPSSTHGAHQPFTQVQAVVSVVAPAAPSGDVCLPPAEPKAK